MGLTLAIANQKGGVGKTATAVNLGAALALDGFRVLLIDLDSQGSATSGLGEEVVRGSSSYEVLIGELEAKVAARATSIEKLDLIGGTRDLAGAEVELVSYPDRQSRLSERLAPVRDCYDYILIDCPPSLGMLTLNALCAADAVVVPLQCEFYALEGLGALIDTLERVRAAFHPNLRILGILLTMYDARTSLSRQVVREVRQHFGEKVLRSMVPRNVRIGESPSYGLPVVTYDPSSSGAVAYRNAAREIEEMTAASAASASESENNTVNTEKLDETAVG
ncbi:MAG TPA: ParA family protein [Candidatus Binatia bacterium]